MSRIRLLRTASFRLAVLYLALFTASALALGAFVYMSVQREILSDFDERIVEETDALKSDFATGGRERLAGIIEARGSGGASFSYGLAGPDGRPIAGDLRVSAAGADANGWTEAQEASGEEPAESKPEVIRSLATPLADGSILIVGDERRRSDTLLKGVLTALGWALGTIGGLWLSAQFLSRVDSMRQTARRLMDGDWSRRIPLSRTDDDLTALARTFNRLFDRIEKLLRANKQVSADIAHDLRKPLAGVLRRLEVARYNFSSGAGRDAIGDAISNVEGVLDTFNALLRIGQVEAGARRAAFRPLDLAEVAREVAEAFAPAAEDEGKALVVTRLDLPLPLAGDKELLAQMIANLIDNALRHTPAGVRIEVGGERTPAGIALSVSDNGPGVAPADVEAIFKRFYRAGEAHRSSGTGLGLALVAAIANLHGLDCRASDNGPGLRVTLATAVEVE